MPDPVKTSIRRLHKELSTGRVTEQSCPPALKDLIEAHARQSIARNEGLS